jgi:hypothetical protein
MVENRSTDGADKSKEKVESRAGKLSEAHREADEGMTTLVDQQKKEMAYQKRTDRPPTPISQRFGKLEITEQQAMALDSDDRINPERTEASAKAISVAMDKLPADSKAILEQLRDNSKTQADRDALQAAYRTQHNGESLDDGLKKQLSGADLERARHYMDKGSMDDGDHLHAALTERGQWISGRPNLQIERDIRDNLASKTPDEIRKMDEDYKKKDDRGPTLSQTIADDPNLSQDTKDACAVYLKGTRDKDGNRPYEDVRKLADIAINSRDESGMREAFRGSSPETRKRFADEGGLDRIRQKAEHHKEQHDSNPNWGMHAEEIASRGELSVATQIRDNTGTRVNNDKAIEANLKLLTAEERDNFKKGREGKLDPNSKEYKEFDNLNSAIDHTSAFEVKRETLRDQVVHPGGSVISHKLAPHTGVAYNDSAEKIKKDIDKGLSKEDFDLYKNSPEHREEVKNYLQNTMKLDDKVVKSITDRLDEKTSAKDYDEALRIAAKDNGQPHLAFTVSQKGEQVWEDKQGFLKQVINAPPAEREALRSNAELKSKVMSSLDNDQQQAMENLLKPTTDGKVNNADIVRAHAVGLGVSKEDVLQRVAALSPEQKEQMKAEYAKTYKSDALYDVTGEMTGIERDRAMAAFRSPARNVDEAMADARQAFVQTHGEGTSSVDLMWDGTGRDYEKVYNRAIEQKARGAMTLEQAKSMNEELNDHRERHVESKKEFSDRTFSVGATVVGMATGAEIGVKTVAAAAAVRDALKQRVVGADGDTSVKGHVYNAAGGAAEVAMMKMGVPGEGAVAESAAKNTLAQSAKQFAKESAQNAGLAAASTVPTSVIDGVHDADKNKSATENMKDGVDRGLSNMASAAVTGAAFHAVARGAHAAIGGSPEAHAAPSKPTEVHTAGENPPASGDRPTVSAASRHEELAKARAFHKAVNAEPRVLDHGQAKGVRLENTPDPLNPYKPPEHIKYVVDGKQVAGLTHQDGWYKLDGMKEGPVCDRKVHVFGSPDGSTKDLAEVQKVILQGIHDDPELRKAISQCKMHNPEIGHTGKDPRQEFGPHGQESKAITFYAAKSEDATLIAQKVDALLSKHPELKLNQPHNGGNIDTIVGPSNRVGIVRDTWQAAPNSTIESPRALVDADVNARVLNDAAFQRYRQGNQLNPEGLRRLENALGLEQEILAYDKQGNLSMKISQDADEMRKLATGQHVDPGAPRYVTESGGEKTPRGQSRPVLIDTGKLNDPNVLTEYRQGSRLTPEGLRAIENYYGLQKGSMGYDGHGNLAIEGSRPAGKDTVEAPGKSSGLSERWAMYKLYRRYGIDPTTVGN